MIFFKRKYFRGLVVFFAVFSCLFFLTGEKAHAQCGFNTIGDYTCAQAPGAPGAPVTGGNLGSQNFVQNVLPSISSPECPIAAPAMAILPLLPSMIQDVIIIQLTSMLSNRISCANITSFLQNLAFFQLMLNDLPPDPCGNGPDVTGNDVFNDAFASVAFNRIGLNLAFSDITSTDVATLTSDVCSELPPGGGVDLPPSDPVGKWCPDAGAAAYATDSSLPGTYNLSQTDPAAKIGESAQLAIGSTTADDSGTKGGGLGCALAVTRILKCAGYNDINITLSTINLYQQLDSSSCYEIVDTGYVDGSVLQPGDILVTQSQGTGQKCTFGHTGIYVGDGRIISNSSSGFQGSEPGTVQNNYSVDQWNQPNCKGVVWKNPDKSAVFRRTCP